MDIGSLCKHDVVTVEQTASLQEAARLMREHHVGALVVTSAPGAGAKVLGVVTDRDLMIDVAVKDGVVTLTGHLETFAEKVAIEDALRRVAGVRAMAIAAERSSRGVPPEKIRVSAENGWVRLQGEVDRDFQRQAVFYKAVRPLMGVADVSNEITLEARPTPTGVGSLIEQALRRQADREAKRIHVDVRDSTVTLNGTVRSWQERDAAQGAAWSAPGVQLVVNNLRVER